MFSYKKIGIANTITLVRILLIPIFLVILLVDWPRLGIFSNHSDFVIVAQPIIAALVFSIIAATDAVDGHLARSRNEVTTFGKFVDPLADKLLVTSALLALVQLGGVPAWVAFVIVAREFVVSGLRMIAVAEGVVIAASPYGKIKTVLQIVAIVMLILADGKAMSLFSGPFVLVFTALSNIVLAAAVIMTIWSMIDYFVKASDALEGPWTK